jgi:hypothetical protein
MAVLFTKRGKNLRFLVIESCLASRLDEVLRMVTGAPFISKVRWFTTGWRR